MRKYLASLCAHGLYFIFPTFLLLSAISTQADVHLPSVFGNSMVLQRDAPLPIWGWAKPGELVAVEFHGQRHTTTATASGEWKLELKAVDAGGPFTLRIIGTNTIELQDILVGEVWLCSGQSNMEMGVKVSLESEREVTEADYPQIRLFHIPKKFSAEPQRDVDAAWKHCTPENIAAGGWGGFSAVAYSFGRELHRELGVPIGLIQSAWGGTRIEPWTPPAGFAAEEAVAHIYEEIQLKNPHSDAYKMRLSEVIAEVEDWVVNTRSALKKEESISKMPTYPDVLKPPHNQQQPSVLYNAMIHPIVPFALRGAIWYQGESNHTEGMLYTEKMKALIGGWRQLWTHGPFPFYYVQIAPFPYGNEPSATLAEFWEAQTAALQIPHTGMAVIHDIGDIADIHPKNKSEVGRRLALWALAKTYGKKSLVHSGPLFRSMKIDRDEVRLRFDHIGSGLAARDGQPLHGFEIIDQDRGGFVAADATIKGKEVIVSATGVKKPAAVRFAWHKLAEPNLMNAEGLPAAPFRAGAVPQRDLLEMEVPEANQYQLVYDLDLGKLGEEIVYDIDERTAIKGAFDRIAYFIELTRDDDHTRYLYVSMDAFTDDLNLIGVPTLVSGARFQQAVNHINIWSNIGVKTGTQMQGGHIEFWPNNYGQANAAAVPGASANVYDFGDQPTEPANGYGSMQIHNAAARQTLFAINHWRTGERADIGIGNRGEQNPDWTFAGNAQSYTQKRLRVLVRMIP